MGMKTKELVSDNLMMNNDLVYSLLDKKSYQKKFYDLIYSGVILSNQYEDDKWLIADSCLAINVVIGFNKKKFVQSNILNKNNVTYSTFIDSIKAFAVIKLPSTPIKRFAEFIRVLKKMCRITDFFNLELLRTVDTTIFKSRIDGYRLLIEYIDFFPEIVPDGDSYNLIYLIYETIIQNKDKIQSRSLCDFNSYFILSEIIDMFEKIESGELLEKFYPIIIWWQLTAQIPLRVTEFVLTPRKCLIFKNSNYYIVLRRTRLKSEVLDFNVNTLDAYFEQTHRITKKLYDLINKYIEMIEISEQEVSMSDPSKNIISDYMLSHCSYRRLHKDTYRKPILDVFTLHNISYLLNEFLNKIVPVYVTKNLQYNFDNIDSSINDIRNINLMDTRHIAIISMIMQGISPVMVKELCGHKSIHSLYNYYDHLSNYIRSWTYNLSRQRSESIFKFDDTIVKNNTWNEGFIEKTKSKCGVNICNDGKGYCSSETGVKYCSKFDGICEDCDAYSYREKHLSSMYERVDQNFEEIDTEIEVIKRMLSNWDTSVNSETNYLQKLEKIKASCSRNIDVNINLFKNGGQHGG